MEEKEEIERLFTALRPLRHELHDSTSGKTGKFTFRLALRFGEPFLLSKTSGTTLTPAEKRLKTELNRIAEVNAAGFFDDKDKEGIYTSIWENPHILSFITPDCRVEGPEGKRLTLSDEQAYVVLNIKEFDHSSTAYPTLVFMADDEEQKDGRFLDDTHILCGDKIYPVKSVGDNYRNIRQLAATHMEKELLDSYLTLFLTYVSNVTPEINGIPPRYSSHTEHAQPTLFLEKVASDKALYLRVGSTVESLAGSLPPGITPTVAVSVSPDRRIRIRKVEDCDIEERADRLEKLIQQSAPDRNAKKEIYRDGYFFIVPEKTAGPFLNLKLTKVI